MAFGTIRDSVLSDIADAIREMSGDSDADETASGSVVSAVTDMEAPAQSLTVQIASVQAGSGNPSPDNVRPISGHTECKVARCGKNFYNLDNQVLFPNNTVLIAELPHNADFVFSSDKNASGLYAYYCDVDSEPQATVGAAGIWTLIERNYGSKFLRFNSGSHKWYKLLTYEDNGVQERTYQLELGSAATDYEPYQGEMCYTVAFPTEAGTVYGGTLDVTAGTLTVTHGNIESYNGEALPEEWISDRDVYEPGKSPTTGAQVVYPLATPITYQLTPQQVTMLPGTHNIWANTGNVNITYMQHKGRRYLPSEMAAAIRGLSLG